MDFDMSFNGGSEHQQLYAGVNSLNIVSTTYSDLTATAVGVSDRNPLWMDRTCTCRNIVTILKFSVLCFLQYILSGVNTIRHNNFSSLSNSKVMGYHEVGMALKKLFPANM